MLAAYALMTPVLLFEHFGGSWFGKIVYNDNCDAYLFKSLTSP